MSTHTPMYAHTVNTYIAAVLQLGHWRSARAIELQYSTSPTLKPTRIYVNIK